MKKGETVYSDSERKWLIDHVNMPKDRLTVEFNNKFNRNQTRAALTTFMGKKLGLSNKNYNQPYTEKMKQFLKENISMSRKELASRFNKKFGTNKSVDALSKFISNYIGKIAPYNAYRYTDEQLNWLLQFKNKNEIPYNEIAQKFYEKFGIAKNKNQICHVCVERLGFNIRGAKPKLLSEEELNWIKENQYEFSRTELAKKFKIKFGYAISKEQLENICTYRKWNNKYTGQFEKGNVPWAKGISKEEYWAHQKDGYLEELRNVTSNRFRKYRSGDVRIRHGYPVLVESTCVGDNGKNYVPYARYLWEKETGQKVADDERIIFLDGNSCNCNLSNMRCVKAKTHMKLLGKRGWYGLGEITEAALDLIEAKEKLNENK